MDPPAEGFAQLLSRVDPEHGEPALHQRYRRALPRHDDLPRGSDAVGAGWRCLATRRVRTGRRLGRGVGARLLVDAQRAVALLRPPEIALREHVRQLLRPEGGRCGEDRGGRCEGGRARALLKDAKISARMSSVASCSGGWMCAVCAGTLHSPSVVCSMSQPRRWSMPEPVLALTITHGQSKACHSCIAAEISSSFAFGRTRSTLLSTRHVFDRTPTASSLAASCSLSSPRKRPRAFVGRVAASTTTSVSCARWTADQIARCRIGTAGPSAPGASTTSTCAPKSSSVTNDCVFSRVVWILSETMETGVRASALASVDFPAFVGPTKQQRSAREAAGLSTATCGTAVADAGAGVSGTSGGGLRGRRGPSKSSKEPALEPSNRRAFAPRHGARAEASRSSARAIAGPGRVGHVDADGRPRAS